MHKLIAVAVLCTALVQVSQAADLFANPQKTCSSLKSDGLSTEGWKTSNAFPGEWLCMTTLIPFGSAGPNGMANNIAFYVNGTKASRANDIRLKININNSRQRTQAFARLAAATEALFKALDQSVPTALTDALAKQKPTTFTTDFGKVELILEPGRIEGFKVVLTDASFLAAEEKERNGSAGDFENCKRVVSQKVGYSTSQLSGDGSPVQESDYNSFMLKGRSNDLFFCEVHSGRRYKIKAALGGKFPFKYIAQGSF